jgi:rare lipoprotein A
LKVTNLNNGNFVIVRVNDRLHHRNPRLVDLSSSAAKKLNFDGKGVIKVRVEVIKSPEKDLSPTK